MPRIYVILFLLIFNALPVCSQVNPSEENYISKIYYQVPLTKSQVEILNSTNSPLDNSKKIQNITYYDGLGRPIQEVAVRAGGNKEDIITPIKYDLHGDKTRDYLPYPIINNNGSYIEDPFNSLTTYYLNNFQEDSNLGTINPYSEKHLEKSPINKVFELGAPGMDWEVDFEEDTDHTVKFEYRLNEIEEVKLFKVIYPNNDTEQSQLYYDGGFYPENLLNKTVIKDENWVSGNNHTTQEFKNNLDQIVLKRTFNEGIKHDTYYVYDDYNNLSFVIPPMASPYIISSQANITSTDIVESQESLELYATETITLLDGFHAKSGSDFIAQIVPSQQDIIDNQCYNYRYDKRNRLFAKKIPGKGWEFIVYNKLDQPVLTQDANLRENNKWLFTKYDAYGRTAYTGIFSDPYTSEPDEWERRKLLQADINTQTQLFEVAGNSTIDGINIKWTNNAYPQANINTILTINYYDHYNWDISGIANPGTVFGTPITNKTKSLVTGSKIRVLGTNNWITNVNYYDEKARLIYSGSRNELFSTLDLFKSKLDFVGKVIEDESTHTKGTTTILTNNLYTYDHAGRLKTQSQAINNGTRELIVNNAYDGLGQSVSKKVGGHLTPIPENSVGLQTVDYKYNIRGWLKEINDTANLGTDLFAFKIGYNEGSTPLYNGNISQTQWKTKSINPTSNPVSDTYNYTYDALNRIKTAIDNTGHYGLTLVDYDKNGNILQLNRQGHTDQNATQFGEMDKLIYSYGNGNQLLRVDDGGNKSYGFVEGSSSGDDYDYDSNGNLISDANKNITSILWNHINLPTEIKFNNSNTQKINYTYSADGIKIRKVVNDGGAVTTTDYAGAYQYVNNDLKFIRNFEDGYVYPKTGGGFGYTYYYTDQLDNIRLAYTDDNGDGSIDPSTEIIKEAHFYPFGMVHKGYNNVVNPVGSSFHKYDYQNQERQDELGLNWLQFKYRMHDPAIGRFVSIDPLAADYVHNSTYAFAENKVIKYNELEGLEIYLNKFDRMSYDNKSWLGKAATFVGNAVISVANGGIDAFNYAGDLTDPNAPLTGLSYGANKLADDTAATAGAFSDYAQNTTLSEFGDDVGAALSNVETYENLAGALIPVGAATKVGKLGSVNKLGVADKLQDAANTALKNVGDGKGAVHGTKVHTEFGTIANKIDNVTKEVSYKNGEVVPYGTKGSVRADAVVGDINAPTAIYDLKTGKAKLTDKNVAKYNKHVPGKPPVKEIKPEN